MKSRNNLESCKNPDGTWEIQGLDHWVTTYQTMIQNLSTFVNFKFARYGDGEFNCMFGKKGQNCDKHQYFDDLGQRLLTSFSSNVITGIQPLALTLPYRNNILDSTKKLKLVNADVLHNASIKGFLFEFLKPLENRSVLCVGPLHLAPLFDDMIIIPDVNCWLEYENIKERLRELIRPDLVVILCASMMSEVLIKDFEEENITMIDCGSVFDPFVGVKSRKYHNNL